MSYKRFGVGDLKIVAAASIEPNANYPVTQVDWGKRKAAIQVTRVANAGNRALTARQTRSDNRKIRDEHAYNM